MTWPNAGGFSGDRGVLFPPMMEGERTMIR